MTKGDKMREIKFRAYDIKLRKWQNNLCVGVQNFESEDVVFMQYINIKDKNDKEIYEGDIIEKVIPTSCYDFEKESSYFEVFYDVATASFKLVKIERYLDRNFAISLDEKTARYCKVIGNVYENSEVLKEIR